LSRPSDPQPCVLILGLLRSPAVCREAVYDTLSRQFGVVGAASNETPFIQSTYYEREMGPGLLRSFLAFTTRRDPGELAAIKLETNALEDSWANEGRRAVNLDPGFLGLSQVVLASGKPVAHRIYVGRGIYAEVELVFERGAFRPLPWTYPDYREEGAVAFFNAVREGHRVALKEHR